MSSIPFTARFETDWNIVQTDIDEWEIEGVIIDDTMSFYSHNIQVGSILYMDGSDDIDYDTYENKGYLRYRIIEIDNSIVDGINFGCTIKWDDDNKKAKSPVFYGTGFIGKNTSLDACFIPTVFRHSIPEGLIAYARSMETERIATRLELTRNLTDSLRKGKEPVLGLPTKDGSFLVSDISGRRFWKDIDPIDKSEKGVFDGLATLDWQGKIPTHQLPAIAITDVLTADSEKGMLALIAQKGDVCIRTDSNETYILKNSPSNILDNWSKLAASSGGGGSSADIANSAYVANEAKKIQPFRIGGTYSKGEMVMHNNLIYASKKGLFSVKEFNKKDWMLVAGNMDSFIFDSDGDGIIDYANHANSASHAMLSDISKMIQGWKPNTQYTSGEQIIYANEIWIVKKTFTSGIKFDYENLEPVSIKKHSTLLEIQGGNKFFDEYYHLNLLQYNIANSLSETKTGLAFNGLRVGNMLKEHYDLNNDGIIDKAYTLQDNTGALIVKTTDINSLRGVKDNVQEQIDRIRIGVLFKGNVASKRELLDMLIVEEGELIPIDQGWTYVVDSDESRGKKRTFYSFDASEQNWVYLGEFTVEVRDFLTRPLNIDKETTGILSDDRVSEKIARQADLHFHQNKSLIDTYTFTNAQIMKAMNNVHEHTNKELLETYTLPNLELMDTYNKRHEHINKKIIDSFSENIDGALLYKGKPIEGTTIGGTPGEPGSPGIADLSDFTTNDLKEYENKRYITDAQRESISSISNIAADQTSVNMKIVEILRKIPTNASNVNKLATIQDLESKTGVHQFKDLLDVNRSMRANSFVVVDKTGTKITYKDNVDIKIDKIVDKEGIQFLDVSSFKLANLKGSTGKDGMVTFSAPDAYSTDLLDMPKTFEDKKVLVANAQSMKYELRDMEELTNSKANYSGKMLASDWILSGDRYTKIVEHKLKSKNLIVAFYNTDNMNIRLDYKIVDENQILVYSTGPVTGEVVVNCSQGATGNGQGGSSGSGGTVVTASTFIDDNRVRVDKTYSSDKINKVLSDFTPQNSVYMKAESDAKFAKKNSEHAHTNKEVLDRIKEDENGVLRHNNKILLTEIESGFYQEHWTNQDNTDSLKLVLNVLDVYTSENFTSILGSEFTIKNANLKGENEEEDELRKLKLVVSDGAINILDVELKPEETQKYNLGISPNLKVFVKGKFDANYYISSF